MTGITTGSIQRNPNSRRNTTRSVSFDLPEDDDTIEPYSVDTNNSMTDAPDQYFRPPPPAYHEATSSAASPENNMAATLTTRPYMDFFQIHFHAMQDGVDDIDHFNCMMLGKTLNNNRTSTINQNPDGVCTEYRANYRSETTRLATAPQPHPSIWFCGRCCSKCRRRLINILLTVILFGLIGLWIWYIQVIREDNLVYNTRAAMTKAQMGTRTASPASLLLNQFGSTASGDDDDTDDISGSFPDDNFIPVTTTRQRFVSPVLIHRVQARVLARGAITAPDSITDDTTTP